MPLLVCPNCNVGMTNVLRSGVEIDICPQCRGVWLDRGELEKLLQPLREDETAYAAPPPTAGFGSRAAASNWGHAAPEAHQWPARHGDHHDKHGHDGHYGHQKKTGMRGLLDIFD
ncbi:hypothetical protein CCC_02969 [Paramagnetospirillum magnetotacticum MS-1]|uniref:Transcription factor zinc-finger domain-containing protein n=1 Tax=Paramagnetospirillum magnetotacticum MS-1 TaxID=272627 RepID=A0A0C2YZW0_PARME|nr:zf-TFIIB domain-containing protein [Paramagnetospirillum magnetotacticum]KIM00181.1 hypothetical protein CCC_02969 [Paramagnetospirillum magnetotacticum MS-1]